MVSTVNLTYSAGPGGIIHLGKIAPASAFTPLRTGGTVLALLSAFSGPGFQLLSTAPVSPTYRSHAHGAGVWDNARETMWFFGANTHNIEADMDNAVYGWRASDGLFIKHYDADPSSGYYMDAAGVYWASASKQRPWGMHTFRRMRYIPSTNEIEVVYDANEHAYVAPIAEVPGQTSAGRVPPFWYYNVLTGVWRNATFGQSASFVGEYFSYPVGYDATYGWFTTDGSFWKGLSNAGVLTSTSVSGKANSQYHSYMHVHNGVAYQVGGNASTYLYSKHPLNNIAGSVRYTSASYPALTGKVIDNMPSVKMPDGRILIFPTNTGGTILHAMILDPVANTVTDTGFTVDGVDGSTTYDFSADWSAANNCAILLLHRFSPDRIYAFRPE